MMISSPSTDPSAANQPDLVATLQESLKGLRAENERLQLALAASGAVGLWDWMVDTDRLHGDINFARLYGLDPEKTAAGLTMEEYQEFVLPEDLGSLRTDIRETFDRGADFLVEYRIVIPGLPLRWVECKGRLIYDPSGRPLRFSGTAVDVTKRKQADEAVRANEIAAHEHAGRVQHSLGNDYLAQGMQIMTKPFEIEALAVTTSHTFAT